MPRNSSGSYAKPAGTTAVTGTSIEATPFNTLADDVATALTASLPLNGSAPMQGNLPMGSFRVTNMADGASSNDAATKGQVDAISGGFMASGTVMLFGQTTAPTGWTKLTTYNDRTLRVTSGTVGTGGSSAFSTVFAARTIATANLPSHTHGAGSYALVSSAIDGETDCIDSVSTDKSGFDGAGGSTFTNNVSVDRGITLTLASTDITGSTGSTGGGEAMDFAIQYVDVIFASKD